VAVAFGVITVLLVMSRGGMIPRRRGLVLLAAYAVFVFMTAAEAL
jgi:Ca2+/Na+ antiporter